MGQGIDPDLRALQDVRDCVARAAAAVEVVHGWDQRRVDEACAAMAKAGAAAAYDLARLAVEETGIGRVHYKVLKNLFGSEGVWTSIKDEKTVGIVKRDERAGIVEVAAPVGVIAGIVPTTNPTSTTLFKSLIAVKGRNAIVVSPHPRSRRCIGETVEVLRRALERVGAPADLVTCLPNPTIESTGALMKHPDVAMILATGGTGLVKAAYSSGKPAYGVGPGNVPVYVDRTADVAWAAHSIVASQSFDNGTLCCSEQGIVVDAPVADQLLGELKKRGAHLCDEDQTRKLAKHCNVRGHMNPEVVGLDPWRIAEAAGFSVPKTTTVLLALQGGVGPEWPLSIEILAPVLSVHKVDGWQEGCRVSMAMLEAEGLGHTCAIHARDEKVLDAFFLEKPASRIVVNGPSSQGAVGYSTQLVPSFSLGCGPQAGNITSDNISARHMVTIKRAAFVRRDWAEIEKKDHARVAALAKDGLPRGCGLAGDPALGGGLAPSSRSSMEPDAASNWRGNAPLVERPAASAPAVAPVAAAWAAKVGAGSKSEAGRASAISGWANSRAGSDSPPRGGHAAGSSLSTSEILGMMGQAGTGCPLGPCKGCAHHDATSGSCRA
jgi:acyl-CoA reductase-like NAD-dependent aldehyde dehydrogenase